LSGCFYEAKLVPHLWRSYGSISSNTTDQDSNIVHHNFSKFTSVRVSFLFLLCSCVLTRKYCRYCRQKKQKSWMCANKKRLITLKWLSKWAKSMGIR